VDSIYSPDDSSAALSHTVAFTESQGSISPDVYINPIHLQARSCPFNAPKKNISAAFLLSFSRYSPFKKSVKQRLPYGNLVPLRCLLDRPNIHWATGCPFLAAT